MIPLNAQMLVGALQMAAQLGQERQRAQQEVALAEIRRSALGDMLDALVHKRVDAVQAGFNAILAQYAEQARHYMAQHADYSKAMLDEVDPIRRIEFDSRLRAVDVELARIRADGKLLFDKMTEVVVAIGGQARGFGGESMQPLLISPV